MISYGYEFLKILKKPYTNRELLIKDLKVALEKDKKNHKKEIKKEVKELNNFIKTYKERARLR